MFSTKLSVVGKQSNLPIEIVIKLGYDNVNIILSFLFENDIKYWKNRFTNDVLSQIDQCMQYIPYCYIEVHHLECAPCYRCYLTSFTQSCNDDGTPLNICNYNHIQYRDETVMDYAIPNMFQHFVPKELYFFNRRTFNNIVNIIAHKSSLKRELEMIQMIKILRANGIDTNLLVAILNNNVL